MSRIKPGRMDLYVCTRDEPERLTADGIDRHLSVVFHQLCLHIHGLLTRDIPAISL